MNYPLTVLISILLFPLFAHAHGPTPQKAKESIAIKAPVEQVWNAVKQFDGIASWHPDVKASKGDGKHESGGMRTVTLQNDAELTDELNWIITVTKTTNTATARRSRISKHCRSVLIP
ncbi:SRPBCC family protein [Methylicorpusculum sp.]|uniref:SRPBCC family protein n=1 Tax=Methylicorpusculum sp. TaxID=2713644 RepID=UPI003A0FB8F1